MNDNFLDTFSVLDSELKLENNTILEFENSLGSNSQEKLKVCRIMRNYMSHNDVTFLSVTNEQIKFLNSLTLDIRKKSHIVSDEMKRIKPIKSTELIKNIIMQIVKFPIVPIETKLGIYLVDTDILFKQLAKGNKKIEVPARLPKYKTVSKIDRINSIVTNTIYIVLDDKTSKYIGILIL